jgi:inorganic pyrophosphatase
MNPKELLDWVREVYLPDQRKKETVAVDPENKKLADHVNQLRRVRANTLDELCASLEELLKLEYIPDCKRVIDKVVDQIHKWIESEKD